MYDKPMLGLGQAQDAITAILAEANKEPDRPLAISIVDDTGSMITYSRMDRCREIPKRMATRKAYTCAISGQDSKDYAERMASQGRSVAEMGDPMLAAVQGGLVILDPGSGSILGGIGVSGLSAQQDEDLAKIGLKAMKL
jgi:glc operon protein GlcG